MSISCVRSVTVRNALDDGHNSMAAIEQSRIRWVATLTDVMARRYVDGRAAAAQYLYTLTRRTGTLRLHSDGDPNAVRTAEPVNDIYPHGILASATALLSRRSNAHRAFLRPLPYNGNAIIKFRRFLWRYRWNLKFWTYQIYVYQILKKTTAVKMFDSCRKNGLWHWELRILKCGENKDCSWPTILSAILSKNYYYH